MRDVVIPNQYSRSDYTRVFSVEMSGLETLLGREIMTAEVVILTCPPQKTAKGFRIMVFILSSQNVWEYLQTRQICSSTVPTPSEIKSKDFKNFNLLVSLNSDRHFLVKQERYNSQGKTKGEFQQEWLIHKLVSHFLELNCLQSAINEAIDYDPEQAIMVFNYLSNYCDLDDFYEREKTFPPAIAAAVGKTIATIHRLTFNQNQYRDFLTQDSNYNLLQSPNLFDYLSRIEPELLGYVDEGALAFYRLYQHNVVMVEAIAQLEQDWLNCCLTHGDFRLVNILVSLSWQEELELAAATPFDLRNHRGIIRIIDWEKFSWGDPAYDLGTIMANYLKLWLSSLITDLNIDLPTALNLATTPLRIIQPSLVALIEAYLTTFPEIMAFNSNFVTKTIQFAGFHLIESILAKIEYREPFDETEMCKFQVAKRLLSHPQESMRDLFGQEILIRK